jgi:hypothetical protein
MHFRRDVSLSYFYNFLRFAVDFLQPVGCWLTRQQSNFTVNRCGLVSPFKILQGPGQMGWVRRNRKESFLHRNAGLAVLEVSIYRVRHADSHAMKEDPRPELCTCRFFCASYLIQNSGRSFCVPEARGFSGMHLATSRTRLDVRGHRPLKDSSACGVSEYKLPVKGRTW